MPGVQFLSCSLPFAWQEPLARAAGNLGSVVSGAFRSPPALCAGAMPKTVNVTTAEQRRFDSHFLDYLCQRNAEPENAMRIPDKFK
jgi:hypothetical protein